MQKSIKPQENLNMKFGTKLDLLKYDLLFIVDSLLWNKKVYLIDAYFFGF